MHIHRSSLVYMISQGLDIHWISNGPLRFLGNISFLPYRPQMVLLFVGEYCGMVLRTSETPSHLEIPPNVTIMLSTVSVIAKLIGGVSGVSIYTPFSL